MATVLVDGSGSAGILIATAEISIAASLYRANVRKACQMACNSIHFAAGEREYYRFCRYGVPAVVFLSWMAVDYWIRHEHVECSDYVECSEVAPATDFKIK